jgi:hypothetical protein
MIQSDSASDRGDPFDLNGFISAPHPLRCEFLSRQPFLSLKELSGRGGRSQRRKSIRVILVPNFPY